MTTKTKQGECFKPINITMLEPSKLEKMNFGVVKHIGRELGSYEKVRHRDDTDTFRIHHRSRQNGLKRKNKGRSSD